MNTGPGEGNVSGFQRSSFIDTKMHIKYMFDIIYVYMIKEENYGGCTIYLFTHEGLESNQNFEKYNYS